MIRYVAAMTFSAARRTHRKDPILQYTILFYTTLYVTTLFGVERYLFVFHLATAQTTHCFTPIPLIISCLFSALFCLVLFCHVLPCSVIDTSLTLPYLT
jgi:hypothetical protein